MYVPVAKGLSAVLNILTDKKIALCKKKNNWAAIKIIYTTNFVATQVNDGASPIFYNYSTRVFMSPPKNQARMSFFFSACVV